MGGKHFNKYFQKYHIFFSFAISAVILYACSTTKKVPDGEYLLTKNIFKYEDGKQLADQVPNYVYQKPNKKFIYLFPVGLWMYNMANPKYDSILNEYATYPSEMRNQKLRDSLYIKAGHPEYKGKSLLLDRWLHNLGSPPVILDQNKTVKSTENIRKFMVYCGYWDAQVQGQNKPDSATKKASVEYTMKLNDPTYIQDYYYNIPDQAVKNIYKERLDKSLIKKGDILNQNVLEKEVTRINDLMRSRGYYKFNVNNQEVSFEADTLKSRKQVPLTLEIHKDSADTQRFKVATIGNIKVAVVDKESDFPQNTKMDSLRGIKFYKKNDKIKDAALWRLIILKKGEIYDQKNLDLTKRNLLAVNNFSILKSRDSLRENGTKAPNDSIVDVTYVLKPLPKYDLKLGTDLNYSQILSLSAVPSLGFTSRNVFKGMENLGLTLGGTFGTVVDTKDDTGRLFAFEVSAQSSLTFPRLLLPFNYYKLIPKRYSPSSSIQLGASVQENIGLGRINVNSGLNYFATVNDKISHKLTLFNTQVSFTQNKDKYYDFFPADAAVKDEVFALYSDYNPNYNFNQDPDKVSVAILADQGFQNSLDASGRNLMNEFNQTLINKDRQTQNVLISSMIYNFIYNEMNKKDYPNPFYFSGKVEFAGNLLGLFVNKTDQSGVLTGTQKEIFKIPYSQYVKFDFDVRKYFALNGGKQTLAFRQFIGIGIPYGNSSAMPFVRSYMNGGSMDIRAWRIYGGLGPADSQLDQKVRAYIMDNVKLTTSVEYRVPMSPMFEGALFADAGNIWSLKDSGIGDQFKFNKFIPQMGLGGGFGLRIHVAYITIRFDLAYKFYDPNRPTGTRWVFDKIQPFRPVVNFAFGYPF